MSNLDETLKQMAREERDAVPAWASQCVEDALSNLPRRKRKSHGILRVFGTAVAACLLVAVALPNCSAQAADRLQSLPVVGPLFEVVTFRTYAREDEHHPAQVEVPEIIAPAGSTPQMQESVEQVNLDIQTMTDMLTRQFEQDAEAIGEEGYTELDVRSEVVTNTEDWFTLRLQVYWGGGSGNVSYRYYHIDKSTGEIAKLSDLFASEDYIDAISREIQRQMREAPDLYWIDTEYEGLNFTSIQPDQNFYFAENGDIIIAFDEYEVAPGSTGCPTFQIPRAVFEAYLK
ncbi:MAG: RsiV family protein [Candidatus Avoscillospira sp.]